MARGCPRRTRLLGSTRCELALSLAASSSGQLVRVEALSRLSDVVVRLVDTSLGVAHPTWSGRVEIRPWPWPWPASVERWPPCQRSSPRRKTPFRTTSSSASAWVDRLFFSGPPDVAGRVVAPPGEGAHLGEPPAAVAVIVTWMTWRGAASISLGRHLVSVSGDIFPGPPDVVGSRRASTWPRTTYLGEAATALAAIATREETRRGSSCFTWNASLVGPLRAAPASVFRMKPSPTAQLAMFHVKPLASRTWPRPPREISWAGSRGAPADARVTS